MTVWIVFSNVASDEGVVDIYFSYQSALKAADSYRLRWGLAKEDVWINGYSVRY